MNATAAKRTKRGNKKKGAAGGQRLDASTSLACPSCGFGNQIAARYCQSCGKALDGGGWLTAQTLTVLAAACIALVALGLLFASVIPVDPTPTVRTTGAATELQASSGQPPDLSTMSPREAADRLFNRVMMADEQGNADEVQQFAPMAISAYEMLESLDTDALYHAALIQSAAGDLERARDYTEQLKAIVPEHLLAALLEHRLALQENDQEAALTAIERFNRHYDNEIAIDRPEYQHHRPSIDKFRSEVMKADQNGG